MPRHPWLAVLLSDLLPGAGQIYGGEKKRGVLFIIASLVFCAIMVWGFYGFLRVEDLTASRILGISAAVSTLILLVFGVYVLFDAYRVTRNYNALHCAALGPAPRKQPWLAAFLSNMVPGLGQFYVRRRIKGLAFLIAAVLLLSVEDRAALLSLAWMPLYFFSLKDAYDTAETINGTEDRLLGQGRLLLFILVMLALHAFPYGAIISSHVVKAYSIPSGSMAPTLQIGDRILVDQSRAARRAVQRGAVIVFKYPGHAERNYIKRVIGMEGDKVQIIDGSLYINDRLVETTPVASAAETEQRTPAYDKVMLYEERLDQAAHRIQLRYDRVRKNEGPWMVPAGAFFVLGDNRDNSQDSRFFGFVPRENVEGTALKIYWSWDAGAARVLWNRIGRKIN